MANRLLLIIWNNAPSVTVHKGEVKFIYGHTWSLKSNSVLRANISMCILYMHCVQEQPGQLLIVLSQIRAINKFYTLPMAHILAITWRILLALFHRKTSYYNGRSGHQPVHYMQGLLQQVYYALSCCSTSCNSCMEEKSTLLSGVCGSYIVHHFVGTWLCCAPSTCVVHHRPVLCTMTQCTKCSFVWTYTFVVHNVALYWLGGAHDDFSCSLSATT